MPSRSLFGSLRRPKLLCGLCIFIVLPLGTFLYPAVYQGASWVTLVLLLCIGALIFAMYLTRWLLACDDGNEAMKEVAEPIRQGAEAFLRVQYRSILRITLLVAALLFLTFLLRTPPPRGPRPSALALAPLESAVVTCGAFLLGAFLSGLSGYIGMWIAVRANLRVATAAGKNKYDAALCIALRGGGACGLLVVALCVMGLALLFATLQAAFSASTQDDTQLPHLMVGYGFGASLVALFAQLGGGIFTKAADVGADMVGKVEANIPEDDPRNPVVIADLVGDNVGDCAGRGADLFESIAGEIIGAMVIGADLAHRARLPDPVAVMFFPLLIHAGDLVVSSVALLSTAPRRLTSGKPLTAEVATDEEKGQDLMGLYEDPMDCLKRGYSTALLLATGTIGGLSWAMLHSEQAPLLWLHYFGCALIGIGTSYAFVQVTQYYTDYRHGPVQRIALACKTGAGTSVIAGIAVGLESTAIPTALVVAALLSSFWMGETCGLLDEAHRPIGGLFGTAIATMGMLSTAVFVLAMDTFGPITDNAGGIVEMSHQPDFVRDITDRLDAVGNVTKATTKGYSIGAAGLASFLLFRAFLDVAAAYSEAPFELVNLAVPEVFLSGLLGGMLVMTFSAFAMAAVGRTAQEVVGEVREQFLNRPGILQGTDLPDYDRCIAIVTSASLREMVRPGCLAIAMPVAVGFTMRFIGAATNRPQLGAECVAAFVMFATGTGLLMALFMNNAGGAWDNAKKYIETGAHGGKGSDAHKAAVTGDTVGDPFKDTAGPSLHVLIKLLATVTLVLCPCFLAPRRPL